MTHYWALWLFGNYYTIYKPTVKELFLIIPLGIVFLIGLAYVVMTVYDIPLRKYLTRKRSQQATG